MKHKNTAVILTDALRQNYGVIRSLADSVPSKPRVICVVKADAYGHGIEAVSSTLGEAGCDFFAVSSEIEAAEVRRLEEKHGRRPDILILSHILPENAGDMIEMGVTAAVVSAEDAVSLSEAVAAYRARTGSSAALSVHVKLDTGMNRVGFPADEAHIAETVAAVKKLSSDPNLRLCGIFTHFSCADDELLDGKTVNGMKAPGDYTAMQLRRFRAVIDGLRAAGVDPGLCHCANSAAILALPEAYFDAVRAGVILYGLMPNGKPDSRFRPVMQLSSTVLHIHRVHPGDKISYGATFTADREMTVATIGAGYADGFIRGYTGCLVGIGGKKYRQIGRICMDQFMVDVTPEDGSDCAVHVGDDVLLFGDDSELNASELAARANTINYEVVCAISMRVIRVTE